MVSCDYEELFKILNAHKIKYLVVGAHAVIYYTQPRFTKDLDIWVPPELNKPEAVYKALKQFGVPLRQVSVKDFTDTDMILQIGVSPIRVDILMSVEGISGLEAWKNKMKTRYGKTRIWILGRGDLIKTKVRAGRLQDRLDLKKLSTTRQKKK